MFWFDKRDGRALFIDKRRETMHADTREGRREIVVDPDIIADFRQLPFGDGTFTLVVFDPPHTFAGPNGWTSKKYGRLPEDWKEQIGAGFRECFRVLAPLGTLIFKWNEHRVPVSSILALTPETPLFGQRCGTTAKTHWIVFLKSGSKSNHQPKTLIKPQLTMPKSNKPKSELELSIIESQRIRREADRTAIKIVRILAKFDATHQDVILDSVYSAISASRSGPSESAPESVEAS